MNENKTNINWYPGHMAKTRRQIKENISLVDIVYEVIDSRIPYSSRIDDIDDLTNNKPHILIMTKYDLCDKEETNKFIERFKGAGNYVLTYDLSKNFDLSSLINLSNEMLKDKIESLREKGLKKDTIRALVVGIPNAGKSTLINKIVGRNIAVTGNKPGVTKNLSWIRIGKNIELLDSPGILWPKFSSEKEALNLASTTAIKEEVLPKDKIAVYIIEFLHKYYPNVLLEKYSISSVEDFDLVYETIGKKRGFLMKGGVVDYDRVTDCIINDIKQGKISGITFDRIEDYEF